MKHTAYELMQHDYHELTQERTHQLAALKNNVIVITGGTGFVGTWLAGLIAFLNDHYAFNTQAILIARNIDAFKATRPHLANRRDIQCMAADVRYLVELPTETNWLIHAAGTPDNRFHASNPLETMSIIAQGTLSVLRAVERCSNFKMLLQLSSGLVYGSQPLTLESLDESYAGAPRCGTVSSAYSEAKRFAETLCHSSRSQARIPVMTARPFAFVGPYQSLETPWAINNFIKDALSGNTIRVLGDGETVRSYLYASDMAFWLLRMLTQGQSGEIYNVGSPEPISLANLARMVSSHVDYPLEIKLKASPTAHLQPRVLFPDVSLAEKNLALAATVNLQAAIARTIQWNKAYAATPSIHA